MKNKFQHRFTFPAIVTLLVLAVLGLLFAVYQFTQKTTYPENNSARIMGVEIDQNRSYVDFNQLDQSDVDFVYLRGTQGKSYFDDRYLENRDRIKGTNLDFGTVHYFSDESTAQEQFAYFSKKVGSDSGNLPILIKPAVRNNTAKYYQSMANFANLLMAQRKRVVVLGDRNELKKYFTNPTILFMSDQQKLNLGTNEYSFWLYTNKGRVAKVDGMTNLTMYAFVGSQSKYNVFVGKE